MATPPNPPSESNIPDNPPDHDEFHVPGYARLAYFFAQCPQYNHLRRFSDLSARVLLYRQHKLVILEKKLSGLDHYYYSKGKKDQRSYHRDLGLVIEGTGEQLADSQKFRELLENIELELKEYEEALIRFNELGYRRWDSAKLKHVQRWLADQKGIGVLLSGVDAKVWGTVDDTSRPALDIVQVIQQPEKSLIENFLQGRFLYWTRDIPEWLHILLFWTKRKPDEFNQFSHSTRWFENVALTLGNIGASTLIYGAVTSLYLAPGKALSIVTVIVIALVVTVCGIVFKNQQFVTMIATVCAVLVTLIANSNNDGTRSN